jgi:hypothetical protein
MKLSSTTYIAGKNTVADWDSIRLNLRDYSNKELWESVFKDYFLTRLNDRYLKPIESIKQNGTYRGEGFSIMTIICSIIEFLETTYQGKNYRFVRKNDPPLGKFEYSKSGQIFIDFLCNREPFKNSFNSQTADEFYSNIRCGLLHEARTNGKWTIWGNTLSNTLLTITPTENIVYRDNFYDAILDYVNNHYKIELLKSSDLKDAFLRKFDSLCSE